MVRHCTHLSGICWRRLPNNFSRQNHRLPDSRAKWLIRGKNYSTRKKRHAATIVRQKDTLNFVLFRRVEKKIRTQWSMNLRHEEWRQFRGSLRKTMEASSRCHRHSLIDHPRVSWNGSLSYCGNLLSENFRLPSIFLVAESRSFSVTSSVTIDHWQFLLGFFPRSLAPFSRERRKRLYKKRLWLCWKERNRDRETEKKREREREKEIKKTALTMPKHTSSSEPWNSRKLSIH